MLHVFVEGPDDEHFFSKIYGTCFGTSRFGSVNSFAQIGLQTLV